MSSLVFDEKVFVRTFLIIVIISFFFLLLAVYNSNKSADYCNQETILTDDSSISSYTQNYTLSDPGDYFLQQYNTEPLAQAEHYLYCFHSTLNVTPVHVQVRNSAEVLGESYLTKSGEFCVEISNFSKTLGVECVNCNETEGKTVSLEINALGSDRATQTKDGGVVAETMHNPSRNRVLVLESCEYEAKKYDKWFLLLIAFSMLFVFILVGVNELGRLKW